jgi:hypothetical protein
VAVKRKEGNSRPGHPPHQSWAGRYLNEKRRQGSSPIVVIHFGGYRYPKHHSRLSKSQHLAGRRINPNMVHFGTNVRPLVVPEAAKVTMG